MTNQSLPKRPPRLKKIFQKYPIYLVTCCSLNRKNIFANNSVLDAFLMTCKKGEEVGNTVGPYVLMPDHIHYFIQIGERGNLSMSVKFTKSEITKRIRLTKSGMKVWQSGFFDHLIRNENSFHEKWRYIDENPVRAGLVTDVEDWPWRGAYRPLKW